MSFLTNNIKTRRFNTEQEAHEHKEQIRYYKNPRIYYIVEWEE